MTRVAVIDLGATGFLDERFSALRQVGEPFFNIGLPTELNLMLHGKSNCRMSQRYLPCCVLQPENPVPLLAHYPPLGVEKTPVAPLPFPKQRLVSNQVHELTFNSSFAHQLE